MGVLDKVLNWDLFETVMDKIIASTLKKYPDTDVAFLELYLTKLLKNVNTYEDAVLRVREDAYFEGWHLSDENAVIYALTVMKRYGFFED